MSHSVSVTHTCRVGRLSGPASMETPRCWGRRAVVYDLAGATAMGGIGQSQMDIYHTVRKRRERRRRREFGGNGERKAEDMRAENEEEEEDGTMRRAEKKGDVGRNHG